MALVMDPAGDEIKALKKVVQWQGSDLLEVGCGDGRLTLRLAKFGPAAIIGIDPGAKPIRTARRNLPKRLADKIHYAVGQAERIKYSSGRFDLVVFSWVL